MCGGKWNRAGVLFVSCLIGCAISLALAATAFAAPRMVAPARAADALHGRLLLTRCHAACRLFTSTGGTVTPLPIESFDLPDVAEQATLGVGPHGHDVAAYSRCSGSLRDCDLYTYDFVTGREQRLAVSSAHGALTNPTVSGNRVAYNFDPRGLDLSSKRFGVFWSRLDQRRRHRVATMPFDIGVYLPTLALSGRRLAYSGYSAINSCLDQSQVRVANLGAKRGFGQLIAKGSDRTDVFSPHWSGGSLYFGRDRFTKRSYRHDFLAHQIAKSRIERHVAGSSGNEVTRYGRAAMREVLPAGDALLFYAVARKRSPAGVYDAGTPAFRKVSSPG